MDFAQNVEFAFKVLNAADKYDVVKLRSVSGQFISSNFTKDSVLMAIFESEKLKADEIFTGCIKFLRTLDGAELTVVELYVLFVINVSCG